MRLFNWANLAAIGYAAAFTGPASASCLPSIMEKRLLPETVDTACKGNEQMPFKVQAHNIGEGGYIGYETKARQEKNSLKTFSVGILSEQAGPIRSEALAMKMVAHFERRKKCPADEIRYSKTGPTVFRIICNQSDLR